MSKEEIIEAVKAMTVVELSELVKAIEEEFGVSAVADAPILAAETAAATAHICEVCYRFSSFFL